MPLPWDGVTTWLRRKSLPDGSKGRWASPDGHIVWSTHLGSNEPEYDTDNPVLRSSQPLDEKENLTDAFTREACDFIHRHRTQPFFLSLNYYAVHSPMQAADSYMARFAHIENIHRRIFAGMLAHLDDSIGKVFTQLRECDVENNTLVVFVSDNGGPTKELTSSNVPLRGGKGELWEGGIRVPFIISWKGRIASQVVETPVISLDASAMVFRLAGESAARSQLDGINLLPLVSGETKAIPERTLYWRVGRKNALRRGNWKLIRDGSEWKLYDLANDIGESSDVSANQTDRVQQLSAIWEEWNDEQIESLWK